VADKAEGNARREYFAAMRALAASKATSFEGVISKLNWACESIPIGETQWDGQMLRSIRADLRRIAARPSMG
jgi:hypothetical protein